MLVATVRQVRVVMLLGVVVAAGCQRDPGRDVQPMSSPLASESAVATDGEILAIEDVRKSQAAAVSQRVANTEITVTYSRPVARGRELFGGIVPYGVVWNPGADQATAVAISRDVLVNGQPLAAGKYSIWAVPGPDTWTLILSRAADVYHTPYPGEAEDALRVDVPVGVGAYHEVLTFDFSLVEGKDAVLSLRWGTVVVPLSIVVP